MSCGSTHFACDCMRARIAVLESALRKISKFTVMPEGLRPDGTPYMRVIGASAVDIASQALQGEASKGGNAFNTSTPVPAESTSESKALVEHAHNTSDLLAAVGEATRCLALIRDKTIVWQKDAAGNTLRSIHREASDALFCLSPFLEPSPAEQEGDGK